MFLHSSELVITNMNSVVELYMEPRIVFLDQRRELWGIVFRIVEKIREAGTESSGFLIFTLEKSRISLLLDRTMSMV